MKAPDLHCHSSHSILDAVGKPGDIPKRAKELGWTAAAITEHGSLLSATDFYKACRAENIKPIIGSELYVVPDDVLGLQSKAYRTSSYHLTTLALSAEGYHNLVAWTSFANRPENFYYKPRISPTAMMEVAPYPMHHNVILSGCLGSELLSFMCNGFNEDTGWVAAIAYCNAMKSLFPNFYLEFQNHRVSKFDDRGLEAYDDLMSKEKLVHKRLSKLHKLTGIPCVVTNDSHMQSASQRKSHMAMKIATWGRGHSEGAHDVGKSNINVLNEQLNAYSYLGNYMRSMEKIADGVPNGEKAIGNVIDIVNEADIKIKHLDDFTYSIPFSGYDDPESKIRRRAKKRLDKLVKKYGKSAKKRFEMELDSMGDFAHYLLIMSDIIIGANKMGILTNTRGSAANSILCYCLKIHDIDSIYYRLTFERFYNPSRKKFPDIDIDIDRDRHEDFMRFVLEYMEEREGPGQVVQICNLGTLANRAAFRMVAEAQGVSKELIDEITKLLPSMIDSGMVDEEDDAYELIKEEYPDIYELTSGVFDSIKNISQHACGWLFGTRDRSIDKWIPLCLIASSKSQVTQFNMSALESWGMCKGDFLRLKTLSVIGRARNQLGQDALDINNIPLDDPKTFEMLRAGKTEGVFSLQGKTQRKGCIEVGVESVHDVIAVQALYRPSGTRTGFDKKFCDRRHGRKKFKHINPITAKILGDTYGLPIYQEQVLELGLEMGMNAAEIQQLLDAIKKSKGVGRGAKEAFEKIQPMFMDYALKFMPQDDAQRIWKLMDAFQGYGFNKGHATSYGILAVRAAYLKCNHPQEFFTALLDVYSDRLTYIAAARAEGFTFAPPDINESSAGFSKGTEKNEIRVGLAGIDGIGQTTVREIVNGQPFSSLDDLQNRCSKRALNVSRLHNLAAIGALESLGVAGDDSDLTEFKLLGFTINEPSAFEGFKPSHVTKRDTGEWTHLGLQDGVDITEGPTSVSKMFWIPPLNKKEIYEKKASAWAKVKTHLLTVIDKNGQPFQLKANEDKPDKTAILDFLATKCKGAVICVDGAIRQPFLYEGALTFQLFNVTGTWSDDPQIWIDTKRINDYKSAIIHITKEGKRKRDGGK